MSIEKTVDQSLHNFWESHEAGYFDAGRDAVKRMGYDDEVVDYVFKPTSYYVAQRIGGTFTRPRDVSSDSIPVIGLDSHDSYGFEARSIHSLQEPRLTLAGVSVDGLRKVLAQRANFVSTSGRDSEQASVFVRGIGVDDDQFAALKPALLLNYNSSTGDPSLTNPDVILHELVHLTQFLDRPVQRYDSRLQRELEAYAVQATLLEEYRLPYTASLQTAATVDQLRQLYLGPDGYVPTQEFVRAFRNHDQVKHIGADPIAQQAPVKA